LFENAEEVDISLILQGKARGVVGTGYTTLGNYITDIATARKDCVAFVSPAKELVVGITNTQTILDNLTGSAATSVATSGTRSTYAVVDTGYKYRYDKHNDAYVYTPLNADVAGLCVRTDNDRDPWFSPAGLSRGIIKNIVKLAYNPSKAHRDTLYKKNINPVITQSGQGTLLFGDKTFANATSAFDRINVRRLFIVLEKTISVAAKQMLFEFNDEFTRAQFRNLIEPFLRDVQGRRGIYDFKVVADDTNNTAEVIDSNRFVGDIFIKPARSINFIQLNFVAVRTGVEFAELVGQQ
jgi:phage tail sheath protein FI